MDLFLMDLILKGKIPSNARVLDVGCGEGRNGIHFIQQGHEYHGWDIDSSKLKLLEYLAKTFDASHAHFKIQDIRSAEADRFFDFIICSRMLHFAESKVDFLLMWEKLSGQLKRGGILYVSMDSIIDNDLWKKLEHGKIKFPDARIHFALTSDIYEEIKKGFEEIEPLKTLVYHNKRAQSFLCFKKA